MPSRGGRATEAPPAAVVERYIQEVMNGSRPDSTRMLIGSEPLRQRAAVFRAAFPDLSVRVVRILAEDRLVAVHLVGNGTHRGTFQGILATGRSWSASCTAIYEVREGRIVDFWVNWDLLAILDQLGALQRAVTASA